MKAKYNSFKKEYLNAIKKYCLGKNVLDFGCGDLTYSKIAKEAGAKEIYALDIKRPSKMVEGIKFLQENAENTSLMDNYFDLIICKGLIEYINLRKCIKEIKRLLKSNGIVIFQTKDSRGLKHKRYTLYCKLKGKSLNGQPQKFKELKKSLESNFNVIEFYQTKPKHFIYWVLEKRNI